MLVRQRLIPVSFLERLGNTVDGIRYWSVHSWRIGSLMLKGAYLSNERRRLFNKLGEGVYYKMVKGEMQNAELEPMVKALERIAKKIELEEVLIRRLRFGERRVRRNPVEDVGERS